MPTQQGAPCHNIAYTCQANARQHGYVRTATDQAYKAATARHAPNTSGPSKWRHFNHAKHQQHPLLLSQKLRCDTSAAQLKLGSLAPTLGSCLAGDSTTAITTPETATGWQHMPPRPGQLNTYAAHTLHMHATAAACCSYTPTLQTAAAAAANTAQKPAAHRCCLTPRV